MLAYPSGQSMSYGSWRSQRETKRQAGRRFSSVIAGVTPIFERWSGKAAGMQNVAGRKVVRNDNGKLLSIVNPRKHNWGTHVTTAFSFKVLAKMSTSPSNVVETRNPYRNQEDKCVPIMK